MPTINWFYENLISSSPYTLAQQLFPPLSPTLSVMSGRGKGKARGKNAKRSSNDEAKEAKQQDSAPQQSADAAYDEFDFQEPAQEVRRPSDAEDLTEQELVALVDVSIRAADPNRPRNEVEFSFKTQEYVVLPEVTSEVGGDMRVQFALDGNQLFHESQEFLEQKKQLEDEAAHAEEERRKAETDGDDGDVGVVEAGKNQFTYSERAAQTFNNQCRDRGVVTQPPTTSNFQASVTQWSIYDTYMESFEFNEKSDGAGKDQRGGKDGGDAPPKKDARDEDVRLLRVARYVCCMDCKYVCVYV